MILQTLDIKNNCKGIFHHGTIVLEPKKEMFTEYELAWKHSPMLESEKFKYLYILSRGEELSKYSAESDLMGEYRQRFLAQQKAAATARIDLEGVCFFDLLPPGQLEKWFSFRQRALEQLYGKEEFQSDYEILHKAHVLTAEIAYQNLSFEGKCGKVLYDIFGSVTGRLTTKKGSVPVLTLKKEQRSKLQPQNDLFVEFDLNAAEIRTLTALSGHSQPPGDIHEWVASNVLAGQYSREDAKVKLFAWLYNPSASDIHFDKFFSREIFRDFYFPEEQVLVTPFGRKLKVEERKAQNYLLQSTTSDIVVENSYKIQKVLKGKKSNVAFTLHDSVILDVARSDFNMLSKVKKQFESTRWGVFKSTCSAGPDFGNLKEMKF